MHQPFDTMQTTWYAFGEKVVPDAACTVHAIAGDETGADLGTELLVTTGTGCPNQAGMKAATRNTERFADPRYGPDPSVLRNELEPALLRNHHGGSVLEP